MSGVPKPTLDKIGLRYGTDKASFSHNYLEFYELYFQVLREEPITILEIGVLNGASLRTWQEYFPKAKIIGADIVQGSKRFESDRIAIEMMDQSNIEDITRVAVKHGPFDIVIEDGSHKWEHQITSIKTLFPFVRDGGIYIVEDLQTNYGSLKYAYKGVSSYTCVDYLKSWLDLRVADDQLPLDQVEDAFLRTYGRAIQFMAFYRRACLIKKKLPLRPMEQVGIGEPLAVVDTAPPVKLAILAHLGNLGDVYSTCGFINPASENFPFQGISIASDREVLEYRVRLADRSWSEWVTNDKFAGTRGESKNLTGISIRLLKHVQDLYGIRIWARFIGSTNIVEADNGQDCISLSEEALCGIQIELFTAK